MNKITLLIVVWTLSSCDSVFRALSSSSRPPVVAVPPVQTLSFNPAGPEEQEFQTTGTGQIALETGVGIETCAATTVSVAVGADYMAPIATSLALPSFEVISQPYVVSSPAPDDCLTLTYTTRPGAQSYLVSLTDDTVGLTGLTGAVTPISKVKIERLAVIHKSSADESAALGKAALKLGRRSWFRIISSPGAIDNKTVPFTRSVKKASQFDANQASTSGSVPEVVTTPVTVEPPTTPTNVVTAVSGVTITLSWSTSGATYYNIYNVVGGTDTLVGTVTATSVPFTISAPGTYGYKVSAVVGDLESAKSAATSDTVATPATPVLTSFAQTSLTSARLSYTCASCVGTFKIYSNNSLVASIPGLTYDLTVASNTTYAVTASFVSSDTGFASPKPTALSLTTMATPSAPTITLGAGASVIASTVAVSGASAYLFYEKPYSGGSEVLVQTSTATSFSHSDSSTNTLFSYRVVYVKNGITSAFSPVSSLTTPNPGRSSITAVKGSGVDRGHMMLNWTSVPSVDYYRISRYLKGVYGLLIPAATTSFSYVDTSPTPSSVSYQANIEACESHDFCAVTSQSASWSIDALPSVPVVTTTINGTGQLDITLSTAGSLSSQCFYKTTSGVSTSDTAVATFTGLSQSFIGLTDGQIYYIACRNSNVMWDGPLSDEVSETPRARMAAFTLAATTPSRITKGSSQNPISTVSGWTAGHYGSIDIFTAYTSSSVATLTPSTSTQSITAPMTRTDSTTAMVVTFTAKDRHYPATTLGTTTVSVLGKLPFTYTKAIVTDANVCKVRYTTNSTSLDNGDTNPILMTLSGDSSDVLGALEAASKTISGATAVDLAELTIPAFGEGIKAASGVSTGAQYLSYDWLAYPALPTTASQISTASSACVIGSIATSPACWSWQWRTIGMSRKVGTTAEACSTCNSENKPYGVTDSLDWTGTIAVGGSVAAGTSHVCYVTTSDTVKCAGSNNYGQLGNDTVTNSATMVDVLCGQAITADCAGGKLSRVVKIVARGNTTCALSRGGVPYCWGAQTSATMFDASISTPSSVLTPRMFRDSLNFPFGGAVDIGFSTNSIPYGVRLNGRGIGFDGVDITDINALTDTHYAAIFATGPLSMDNATSASWFTTDAVKIQVERTSAQPINHVSWTLSVPSLSSGSADDARNAACQKVTLLTK